YYLLPAVPFMGLLVAAGVIGIARHRWGRVAIGTVIASWVFLFAFAYPMLAEVRVSLTAWDARTDLYELCPVNERTQSLHAIPRLLGEACTAADILEDRE
ncbi:MAG: hypothetical protein LC808_22235, partial [Actinobacteria bacterium]|nr:hypothetical protein [Actinomycetota bacterium]